MTAAVADTDGDGLAHPHRPSSDNPSPDCGVPLAAPLKIGTGSGMPVTQSLGTDPLTRWAQRMRAEGLSRRTVTDWPAIVRRAARVTGADPIRFTTDQVVDYLASLNSPGTRQTYFSALHAWHRWLVADGVRTDNPMAVLRRPRAPRRSARPVATVHLYAVLESGIRRRTRSALLLAACQGLRVHEVAKVRGEDIDLIAGRFRVIGKGGVDKWKPLHPLIAEEARQYPRRGWWFPSHTRPGQPIRSDSLSAVLSRAMKRAGVPGTAHSIRHWYGTELVREGVDVRVVQELMRHASLATTQIYTEIDEEQQRAAILRLPVPRRPVDGAA